MAAIVFTGLATAASYIEAVWFPPRLCVAIEELRVLLNKVTRACPPGLSKSECKEIVRNRVDVTAAREKFKLEENTPLSSAEYALARSTAGHTAICIGCTTALAYLVRPVVKNAADKYQLPQSEAISRVVSAAFASLIAFYFMRSYPINTLQFVFLVIR